MGLRLGILFHPWIREPESLYLSKLYSSSLKKYYLIPVYRQSSLFIQLKDLDKSKPIYI